MIVEDCRSTGRTGLGLHPGSGSQAAADPAQSPRRERHRPLLLLGVKFGLAEENTCDGNRVGISIGHRDTDNLVRKNVVTNSGEVGLLFRPERGPGFCAHRNRIESNRREQRRPDRGGDRRSGGTESVTLVGNTVSETRAAEERIGIRLGDLTRDIRLDGNTVTGFAQGMSFDQREEGGGHGQGSHLASRDELAGGVFKRQPRIVSS